MTLTKGRMLRPVADGAKEPSLVPLPEGARMPRGRVEPVAVVEASDRAKRLVRDAEERAARLLEAAAQAAGDVKLRAAAEGRAEGVAQVAAQAIALAAREARADERALDRSIELARLLAERLLGEALQLDPTRVVAIARQALSEARGARRVRIVAHPADARILEQAKGELGLDPSAIEITADEKRTVGDLRLETEIGVLDAALAPQLERLAQKLRGSLRE